MLQNCISKNNNYLIINWEGYALELVKKKKKKLAVIGISNSIFSLRK